MVGIATKGQLRMSYLRWALVMVPLVLLLGLASGALSGSGDTDWYRGLAKPGFQPPPVLFGIVWPILYVMMGLALAMVINARGSRLRGIAIGLFIVQLAANLAWSPLFFGMREVTIAFWWLLLVLALAGTTTWYFARIRAAAAWLMAPYLAWLLFAAALAFEVDRLNPDAETLANDGYSTQI